MARQRAGQASAAFGRVGAAQIPASDDTGITESGNAVGSESGPASGPASVTAPPVASYHASAPAHMAAGQAARTKASRKGGKRGSRKARGKAPSRRVGRPPGPDRTQLSVRVLDAIDDRLDIAVEMTGQSPQTIVEAALSAYLDALGVPQVGPWPAQTEN